MQIKCKMSTSDTQNNNCLILITKLFSAINTVGHIPTIWKKGLVIPVYKGGSTPSQKYESYIPIVLLCSFPNFLRRLYSQEFNIGLKHFQLYYQTSSSMDSSNLKIVLQRFVFCLKPCCLFPNFTVLYLLPFMTLCGLLIRFGMQDSLIN